MKARRVQQQVRTVTLLLGLAFAALAQSPKHSTVRFHGSLVVGKLASAGHEFWCELEIWNGAAHAETFTTTVRRRAAGALVSSLTYKLAPHEKRTIRIEDPTTNLEDRYDAGEHDIPEELRATLLIEPVSAQTVLEIRQLELYGNTLRTLKLKPMTEHLNQTRSAISLAPEDHAYIAANLTNKPALVEVCRTAVLSKKCSEPPEQMTVPPYATLVVPHIPEADPEPERPNPLLEPYRRLGIPLPQYERKPCHSYLVLHPKDLIVEVFTAALVVMCVISAVRGPRVASIRDDRHGDNNWCGYHRTCYKEIE
jgi:hypothetical protein